VDESAHHALANAGGREIVVPLFTTRDSVAGSGRAPIPGNISGRS